MRSRSRLFYFLYTCFFFFFFFLAFVSGATSGLYGSEPDSSADESGLKTRIMAVCLSSRPTLTTLKKKRTKLSDAL